MPKGISELVADVRSGLEPTAAQLNPILGSGCVPLPRAAIEAVASELDASVRRYKADALAAQLALAKSKWDLMEDLHKLKKAVQASEITPDQEKATRIALANLQDEIRRLEELKQILDEHFKPAS